MSKGQFGLIAAAAGVLVCGNAHALFLDEITSISLVGSFQTELGCSGDFQADCAFTQLFEMSDGVWSKTFQIPVGFWEYIFAANESLDLNWGASGVQNGDEIGLSVSTNPTEFLFSIAFDTATAPGTDRKEVIGVTVSQSPATAPEPVSIVLMAVGLLGVGFARKLFDS